ncbi:o-succinylbenzoate--CoA ligase [Candidatus Magnetomorum sp. HK-1]|nr:o-succinylbenzoate--CoA ligase [Candidatus Magnetomorum sp. HK-1]
MDIDQILKNFSEYKNKTALIKGEQAISYFELLERIAYWNDYIIKNNIKKGEVVALVGDFSTETIALFFTLLNHKCILVPLSNKTVEKKLQEYLIISQAESVFSVDNIDNVYFSKLQLSADHEFFSILKQKKHPGLIAFTSGSSGVPKAAVHDFDKLLAPFEKKRPALCMINFLLFDHLGGINTMLHILCFGGMLVVVEDRTPDKVCELIEKHKVEVLPTSPTFLNYLLLSKAYKRFDLSSLKALTYGAEPMPEKTLMELCRLFPDIKIKQTYGLIETGSFKIKSKSSDSLLIKIGDVNWRIVDNILQIRCDTSMIGYLNAHSPFTEDGYLITGDMVEVHGEYIKVIGRQSEQINIGGEKVFPQEVENLILKMDNVAEVTVFKEEHPLTGNILCAKVRLIDEKEDRKSFTWRLKQYCSQHLESYKVPIRVKLSKQEQCNVRFKKIRYGIEKL